MPMTPGERAIWAAAFVEAYNSRVRDAVRMDPATGAFLPNDRLAAFVPLMAIEDAARLVRIARESLPKMIAANVKPAYEETHREATDMLREMLGVDASGNPYR